MEKIKCSECGSFDIVRDSWTLVCKNCNARFSLDSAGKESKKLDELMHIGITALDNEDYRNAASFFKQALDINPSNGRAYHYYNYASDNEYLARGGKGSIENLSRSIKGKIGTVLDMYNQISDIERRNELIEEAIDDLDDMCRKIATVVLNGNYDSQRILGEIEEAYRFSFGRLNDNNESKELADYVIELFDDYDKQVNNIINKQIEDSKQAQIDEDRANAEAQKRQDEYLDRLLNGTKEEQAERAKEKRRRDRAFRIGSICQILLMVASVAFLFLTVFSITKGWGIGSIVFFGIATAASIYGAKEEDFVKTVLILILDYFVMFDFGIGLGFIWRAIIGIILLVLVIRSV